MISLTPKRTGLMLKIRRLLTVMFTEQHANWPPEAVTAKVTAEMREISKLPIRKVRVIARSL